MEISRTAGTRSDCVFGIGLALLLLAYFAVLETARPHFFLHDDNASQNLPDFLQTYDTLTHTGRVSEINFYQYGGMPVIALGQSSALYPPDYVCTGLAHLLGDGRWAIDLAIILHFIAGAIGFFVLLRRRGVHPILACCAGCLWVVSPYELLISSNGCTYAYTGAYLPWIFCALDLVLDRPELGPALLLTLGLTLYFYCGIPQIFIYVVFFAGLYFLVQLPSQRDRKGAALGWLAFAGLLFVMCTPPLLFPIVQATLDSVERDQPMKLHQALQQSVQWKELIETQFLYFGKASIPGVSSGFLLCPELLLLPVAFLGRRDPSARAPAWSFLLLAFIALCLSTRLHAVLSLMPPFNHLRWPFKVFFFWKFFFLLFLFTWLSPARLRLAAATSALIVALVTGVVLVDQKKALFSHTLLPTLQSNLTSIIDPLKGRAVGMGDFFDDGRDFYRYLGYRYGTVFQIPVLGGYNPLIGRGASSFGLGLKISSLYSPILTPEVRDELNHRCVRYFLVEPASYNTASVLALDGTRVLQREPDRIVLENLQAAPMVVAGDGTAANISAYRGNSLLVRVPGGAQMLGVSLSPSRNWWYRTDQGPWVQPAYHDDRAWCVIPVGARMLEVRYVDAAFHAGLATSLLLAPFAIAVVLSLAYLARRRDMPASGE